MVIQSWAYLPQNVAHAVISEQLLLNVNVQKWQWVPDSEFLSKIKSVTLMQIASGCRRRDKSIWDGVSVVSICDAN